MPVTTLYLDGLLGGKILDNRQEAERLGEQMMHVETVIKMQDPAYKAPGFL
jgi:hypothetical protein